jgi:hypothetical protein
MTQISTTIPVEIVLMPERCYRCGRTTCPVVGLWFDRGTLNGDEYPMFEHDHGWFFEYNEQTAHVIATVCSEEFLAAHGSGALRWSSTRGTPDGYLANTCHHCGTVLRNGPLHEVLTEFLDEGGSLDELPRIPSRLRSVALTDRYEYEPKITNLSARKATLSEGHKRTRRWDP